MGIKLYEAEDRLNLAFGILLGFRKSDFGEVELVLH